MKLKGKSLQEKKTIAKFAKALACELDCKKCKKDAEECRKGIRMCLNILMKDWAKRTTEKHFKKLASEGMVS